MYDYNYWLQPAPKRESFAAWEKRHRNCLRVGKDGKPFYDWLAAKKVGKRNGQVPAGLYNGIIGRKVPCLAELPKSERMLYENPPPLESVAWKQHCDRMATAGLSRHTHEDWERLWRLYLEPGEAVYLMQDLTKQRWHADTHEYADFTTKETVCQCRACKAVRHIERAGSRGPHVFWDDQEQRRREDQVLAVLRRMFPAVPTQWRELAESFPADETRQKYLDYRKLMEENKIEPRSYEAWLDNYQTVRARQEARV